MSWSKSFDEPIALGKSKPLRIARGMLTTGDRCCQQS
jgi:hypothetical protein